MILQRLSTTCNDSLEPDIDCMCKNFAYWTTGINSASSKCSGTTNRSLKNKYYHRTMP